MTDKRTPIIGNMCASCGEAFMGRHTCTPRAPAMAEARRVCVYPMSSHCKKVELEDEITRLTNLIEEHNRELEEVMCDGVKSIGCRDYLERGRLCPSCPRHYTIDIGGE